MPAFNAAFAASVPALNAAFAASVPAASAAFAASVPAASAAFAASVPTFSAPLPRSPSAPTSDPAAAITLLYISCPASIRLAPSSLSAPMPSNVSVGTGIDRPLSLTTTFFSVRRSMTTCGASSDFCSAFARCPSRIFASFCCAAASPPVARAASISSASPEAFAAICLKFAPVTVVATVSPSSVISSTWIFFVQTVGTSRLTFKIPSSRQFSRGKPSGFASWRSPTRHAPVYGFRPKFPKWKSVLTMPGTVLFAAVVTTGPIQSGSASTKTTRTTSVQKRNLNNFLIAFM